MDNSVWCGLFPGLFRDQPFSWGGVGDRRLRIAFTLEQPADALISNVKILGRCGGGIVVVETDKGWRSLPGGGREPGEAVEQTARRELAEEAGGVLTSPLIWIGSFRVDCRAAGRFKPHLPWPISYWAYLAADVRLAGRPTNPKDGEQVVRVQALPVAEAIDYLAAFDDGPSTEVIRLAVSMGLTSSDR